jgi:hypothetical protein
LGFDESGGHDDRGASVGDVCVGGRFGVVGEKRVIALDREQGVLVVARAQPDPSHHRRGDRGADLVRYLFGTESPSLRRC